PPARGFFDRKSRAKQDAENLARLLGTEHLRPLPWEKTSARNPRSATPPLLAAVRGAAALEAAARKGDRRSAKLFVENASPAALSRSLRLAMHRGHQAL